MREHDEPGCRYCGGTPRFDRINVLGRSGNLYRVECEHCHAATTSFPSILDAVHAWRLGELQQAADDPAANGTPAGPDENVDPVTVGRAVERFTVAANDIDRGWRGLRYAASLLDQANPNDQVLRSAEWLQVEDAYQVLHEAIIGLEPAFTKMAAECDRQSTGE